MSNDFGLDLDEIVKVLDTADVMIIRFQLLDQRLLIDARSTQIDPPLVKLVPRAGSVEERFRGVKQLRPRLPVPERIMSFQWPRHAKLLADAGVWQRIVGRMTDSGHAGMDRMCDEVWRQILAAERREEIAAIRGGEGFKTLWQRDS